MTAGERFLHRLRDEILIGDGAMGSYLHAQGLPVDTVFEHTNLTNELLIRRIHEEYLAAGAEVIETNTFAANRNKLAAAQLGDRTRDLNIAGARIARDAAPSEVIVLGSVGPVGQLHLEEGLDTDEILAEQMTALLEGGVDGFILETFGDLAELKIALGVAKQLADLPVVAQMRLAARVDLGPNADPALVAREIEAAGADVVGVNCGPGGPMEILRQVRVIGPAVDRPVSSFANASFPRYLEGRLIYVSNADYFAQIGAEIAEAGATLIGGCCGTTPEHIRLLASQLRGRTASHPSPTGPSTRRRRRKTTAPTGLSRHTAQAMPPPNFLEANRQPVNVIVEIDPPRGVSVDPAIDVARELHGRQVNAVSIAENQLASVRMSSWVLSYLVQRESGVTAIAHCTCRDRNLIGQQSELMGAHVLGINHVLAITGDPIALDRSEGTSVFDTNSFGLIQLIARLNQGENLRGESISAPTGFIIGAGVNPNRRRLDGELRRLEKKVALGATFAMTQPPTDGDMIRELRVKTADSLVEIFVGVVPLVSSRNAEFLHNEVPGIRIPDDDRRRMRDAENPIKEGIAIAKETIERILEAGFRGIYIIPMLRKYGMAYELVDYIRAIKAT